MLLRSVICVALVVFASTLCGTVQQHKPSDPQQQLQQRQQHQHEQRQQQQANEGAAWFHGHSGSSIFKVCWLVGAAAPVEVGLFACIMRLFRECLACPQAQPQPEYLQSKPAGMIVTSSLQSVNAPNRQLSGCPWSLCNTSASHAPISHVDAGLCSSSL